MAPSEPSLAIRPQNAAEEDTEFTFGSEGPVPSLLTGMDRLAVDRIEATLLAALIVAQFGCQSVTFVPSIRLKSRLQLARHLEAEEIWEIRYVVRGVLVHQLEQLVLRGGIGRILARRVNGFAGSLGMNQWRSDQLQAQAAHRKNKKAGRTPCSVHHSVGIAVQHLQRGQKASL